MSTTNKLAAVFFGAIAGIMLILAGIVMTGKDFRPHPHKIKILPGIRDNFASTCAVTTDGDVLGSGVMLKSGYVITNKHVVDLNRDATIQDSEKKYTLKFYYPYEVEYEGEVILTSEGGHPFGPAPEFDIAIIKIKNPPSDGADLASDKEYWNVPVGDRIYTIGNSDGETPPHITEGMLSFPSDNKFGRSSAPIFFGNSGGGIYRGSTHRLLGINTRIRLKRTFIVPGWSFFTTAPTITRFLALKNRLDILEPR